MQHTIITVSREWASGGHTVAQLTAEKLGIPCYDTQIIQETAKRTGLKEDLIKDAEQKIGGSFLYNLVMNVNAERNYFEQIYKTEREIILEHAKQGPCVIVGRGADHVVENKLPTLRVFVYSNMKRRIQRAINNYGLEEAKARSEIQRMDKERAIHMKTFTGLNWGERINYDVMLNAGYLGEEMCSDIIVKMYQDLIEQEK
ncbi:MAG: cytidylate kinase-like family protein [Eubacterium sp.]|nr:cytidylate kinase-like family protein [Eubacterium sp.]